LKSRCQHLGEISVIATAPFHYFGFLGYPLGALAGFGP
jgi:hypothetical protein